MSVDQSPTGTLISCVRGQTSWSGGTTVTVVEGADIEMLVRGLEASFAGTSYGTGLRRDTLDYYEATVSDRENGTSVRVSDAYEPNEIRIDSSSACFTLPEGMVLNGEF